MEDSHHRSIIDHLELGAGGHHLQEDLSKGVLRTIHNVENGTLHFITIPPAANSREQEYIDLLSNHNGLLVDYISAPGPPTPSNQFHPQTTNLLDHHGGIQTYTAEDLQTLVDASSLQTSENDRKLFLQFVNKPNTQLSHEAPVIVTNPKDISSVNPLNEHDKLTQSSHTQLTNINHMPVATSGSNYLHYHHQDQLLSTTHNSVNPLAGTGNVLAPHHNAHHHHHHHHHHPHHHGQAAPHQIIQNTAQQHQQQQQQHQQQQQQQHQQQHQQHQQQQQQQQQQNQSHLSSIHSMLQGDCSPSKLFHVASSTASTNIAISTATSQNCIQMPPLTPIKRVESPKRYLTYQMVQTQASMDRSATDVAPGENFLSRDDLMDCEPRTDDEEDTEAANALNSSNHFTNTYLPHKKRLAKTMVDAKLPSQVEQFHRDSVISNDHQQDQQQRETQQGQPCGVNAKVKIKNFACQLCSDSFEDQLMFFTHLKGHYEPPAGSPTDDGKSSDPKKKPKLPRVKHTKKLKNDKSSRTTSEDASTVTSAQESQPNIFDTQVLSQGNQVTSRIFHQQNQVGTDVIVSPRQQTIASVGTEPDNAGEFSETEDMLEGIRNVVQKVQEAVDTDTNDGLSASASGRSVISAAEKAWFQAQQQQQLHSHQSDMAKTMDFGAELDTQEIHISAGTDNFVLFLNKSDFHEQEMLNHPSHQNQTSSQQQPVDRLTTSAQHHPMLTDQLQPNHNPPAAFILDAEQQLQPPTMSDCDMNIQILGLGSTVMHNSDIDKLVDFTLTAPQLSELSGAKLLKDELKSNEGSEADVDRDNDEYYLSDEEEEDAEGEDVETIGDGEEHGQDPSQHHPFSRKEDQNNGDDVTISSAPPGKKKGRKKMHGELQTETEEQDATKKAGKKYPCAEPDCDKVFNSKTAVRYHELQHKNERPYKCVQCPKNFFTSSALKVHERLHSGEKPYKCEECGRAFRQWGDMKYHQSSIHSNEKTHQCEFCGKKFARRYSLVLHRKIHLNEKNHVCDICNKAFRASSYLQSHRMIHTGEKPYSCNICMKKFRCGGDMKRHLKTHDRNKTSTSGKSSAHDEDSFEKPSTKSTPTGRSSGTDVIDLTKIKYEGSNKVSAIQAPPVVTVLAKDISHAGTGTKITTSAGQLVYLTQGAGDQFRKPDETVLMDVSRW